VHVRRSIAGIADRLVNLVVPRVTAGACACGDRWVDACGKCGSHKAHLWQASCDCSKNTLLGCVSC